MSDTKTFEVTSGALAVSDPCYEPDTWCLGRIENAKNGKWHAAVDHIEAGDWGDRIALLAIWHEDRERPEGELPEELDATIGVDSGQAGFFDAEFFDKTPRGKYHDKSSFYGAACELTTDDGPDSRHYWSFGILMGRGVVSSSGFGDGAYDCYIGRDADGKVDAAHLVFIYGEDLQDEDAAEEEAA